MYSPYGQGRVKIRFGGPLTPAVKVLLVANVAIFLFTFIPQLLNVGTGRQIVGDLFIFLGMTPTLFWGNVTLWMPFTYMFLHAGLYHILFNMFALWMFGGDVEGVFGTRQFVVYYMVCGVGAGMLVALLEPGLGIPTIGASGAIYGVILAFGLFFPNRIIYFSFLIPIKAKWFVLIVGLIVFLSSFGGSGGGISHIAHLGGLVFGFIFIQRRKIWALLRGIGRKRRRPDLRVIDMERIRKMFDEDDDHMVH